MNFNFLFFSIRLSSLWCCAWREENLFLHRIRAGHNCVSLFVCLFLRRSEEEEEIHEKAKQEDIEEMAQSEEMRNHKL
jgi:hypothetical protein